VTQDGLTEKELFLNH